MSTSPPKGALVTLVPPDLVDAVSRAAAAAGRRAEHTRTVGELLGRIAEGRWAATVLSFSAEHVDEELVTRLGEERRAGALLLTTPTFTLERAVAAERAGALGLLREPLDEAELVERLRSVEDEGPAIPLEESVAEAESGAPTLLGDSPEMARVLEAVARVARSDATVLVTGESGTGKEVVARALHWASDRRRGPFVAVNCAAIPEHLLESELFGHEKGAFTGAVARRVGRFERANGGTLFLDEIGDMSLVLQAKILRVLEEQVVDPVGSEETRPVDARIVAATNQPLEEALEQGSFREDLFYRLAVVELHLPPLRERGPDIRRLALHFGAHFARRHGRDVSGISKQALRKLEETSWPGNVRELRNVMDRAILLARGDVVRTGDLRIGSASQPGSGASVDAGSGYPASMSLAEVEAEHIERVLRSVAGHIGRASEVLGIHRNTLARKMRDYDLEGRSSGRART